MVTAHKAVIVTAQAIIIIATAHTIIAAVTGPMAASPMANKA